jgi:hypothetical protein
MSTENAERSQPACLSGIFGFYSLKEVDSGFQKLYIGS